jgi:parallel beta-helix repeat protein
LIDDYVRQRQPAEAKSPLERLSPREREVRKNINMKKLKKLLGRVLVMLLLLAGLPLLPQPARAVTYTVINTNDSGPGSLRQAIIDANTNPGPDTIAFDIPLSDPGYSSSNAWLIQPSSLLPSLTGGSTTIDGSTQTTNQGDTNTGGPEVQLDGSNLASTAWIFSVESNANTIKGLAITRAGGAGIKIIAGASGNTISDNYIGTDPAGVSAWGNGTGIEISGGANGNTIAQNVISGNTLHGVMVAGSSTNYNNIRSNYIGLDPLGVTAIPNGRHGVFITNGPQSTNVGGDTGYRNYISGNSQHGVYITGSGTDSNLVWYNYIGTDGSGAWDVGNGYCGVAVSGGAQSNTIQENVISGNNQHGVYITGSGTGGSIVRLNVIGADAQVTQPVPNGWHGVALYDGAQSNWIGTPSPPWGNTIVASSWTGVAIVNSDQNTVMLNAIGTDATGTATNLGNGYYGVHVGGNNNTVGPSNTIAHNGSDGIRVDGSVVTTLGNRITQNAIFSNGGKGIELVSGGNSELSAPIISQVSCHQVEGSACAGCTVEIFSDAADEGRVYKGATTAHSTLQTFSWSGSMIGPNVTATATDGQGNTSEFSAPGTSACHRVMLPLVLRLSPQEPASSNGPGPNIGPK